MGTVDLHVDAVLYMDVSYIDVSICGIRPLTNIVPNVYK